jgi:hypothetical protein
LPDYSPSQQGTSQTSQDGAWSSLPDYNPDKSTNAPTPSRSIGGQEAAVRGIMEAGTFGFAPAIAGLAEASGIPSSAKAPDQIDVNPVRPVVGAYNMISNYFSDHPDPTVQDAYDRGRKATLEQQNLAQEQNPAAFLAGQLGTAIATPAFGAAKGATSLGRAGYSALAGGTTGSLYGAGGATSKGEGPIDVAESAAAGGATGVAFGGAASGALSGLGAVTSKVASIARGARDTEAEASRRIADALRKDSEAQGRQWTPDTVTAAHDAGLSPRLIDLGGENTRALARSAANTSPPARQALTDLTANRFEEQSPRIAGYMKALVPHADATINQDAIDALSRRVNKPAYAAAYAAGDKPIWSSELERLTSAPYVQKALSLAQSRWKNFFVRDGFGAANSPIVVKNGMLQSTGGQGVKVFPNIQMWDYAARNLQDLARKAPPGSTEAGLLNDLARQLKTELDTIVPEYKVAREGAARFFGASNALEAGQQFVMSTANISEARKVLAKMHQDERELFARGFASALISKIEQTRFSRDVLNSIFLDSPAAKQKIEMALGPQRAGQIEALLRAESIIDQARKSLGNSTTVRQLAESGLAGGGAVFAYEGLQEHSFSPSHILTAALLGGAARHGAKIIDEKVARRVGELLTSNDSNVLRKGLEVVQRNPYIIHALRRITASGARVGAHDVGPTNTAAGVGTVLERAFSGPGGDGAHDTEIRSSN